jgi:hypothetical protein
MSQASGPDSVEDQRACNDLAEQPSPENDNVGPTDEEKTNCEPLAELPPGISNTGLPQPSEPDIPQVTSNVAPDCHLTPEAEKVVAEKDQPTISELANVMKQVLDVLQDSTIASKSGKDKRSRFWGVYKRVAEEHDSEFLERYVGDMDIVLVFSGLFSAVSTSFIVAMETNLSPDPSDTTNALLKQLVYIGLGNFAEAGSTPADPASGWSPTTPTLWIQTIAYASLSMSLLAAFGAVLGKQWLGYYKSNRYGRGSQEERGKRRQEKFDGLVTWYFDAVVQSFPVLLQFSLLLFGIALGAHMWCEQPSIAWVIIATTVFGFLFYSLTVMACLISPACPFQTPISTILRMLRVDSVLRLVFKRVSCYFQQLTTSVHSVLERMLGIIRSRWSRLSEVFRSPVHAVGTFSRRSLQQLITTLHNWLRLVVPHSLTEVVDPEAQSLHLHPDVLSENEYAPTVPDIPTSNLEAPSIKWLLETSTDPEVFLTAVSFVPHVDWPLDLDVSDMLPQLHDVFTSCVGFHGQTIPSLEEKASACIMAMSHLYFGRVLQAYPGRGEFLGRGRRDYDMFLQMRLSLGCMRAAHLMMVAQAMQLCLPEGDDGRFLGHTFSLYECPNSVLEWLSHSLPYHFVTGRVNKEIEEFAIEVISKLLSSPSSPSNQIIANCTLLACVMVGVQFDKKDIIRIDKSSDLPRFVDALLAQFQKVIWTYDGDDLDADSTGITRRAWILLDVICRILEPAERHYIPSNHTMRNLDVCRNIYSQVRSSEQNHPWKLLDVLHNALNFTLTAVQVSRDLARLWYSTQFFWTTDPHSPEDFDWLVDYLEYVYSDDQKAAFDILLLLGVMKVRCSPAKQYQFFKSLIACMDSHMPHDLRHAALRAAHSAREEIASIDAIDDAELRDMLLTEFSPAILTAICPQPGATLSDDNPDCFFHSDRDLCYLELIFALARNSNWHLQLFRDHHIDRCISIIAQCYLSRHAFCLVGILLRIAPERLSVSPLDSITEQQWWDMIRRAWSHAFQINDDIHCFEFLPVLVEGTKRYMQIAPEYDLKELVTDVDYVLRALEERRDSEQGEGECVTVAVKELRTVASDMLEKLVDSEDVINP